MPRDLFADVRPPSRRRVRQSLVVCSVLGHIVALSTLLVAQVFAVGPLPQLPQPSFDWVPAQLTDIELPPPPPRPVAQKPVETSDAPRQAPIEEPKTIGNEPVEPRRPDTPINVTPGIENAPELLGHVEQPPTPPPPTIQRPVRLHTGIVPPRKTIDARPDYPAIARAAHVEGIVIIEATIDVTGAVTQAQVLRSIPLLDQAAVDAVRQWRYTPALLNGSPVPVIITVTVSFRLQ